MHSCTIGSAVPVAQIATSPLLSSHVDETLCDAALLFAVLLFYIGIADLVLLLHAPTLLLSHVDKPVYVATLLSSRRGRNRFFCVFCWASPHLPMCTPVVGSDTSAVGICLLVGLLNRHASCGLINVLQGSPHWHRFILF